MIKRHAISSPPCEIRRFRSADELAQAAAEDWLELLQILELAGREATVALSGGRMALSFFEAASKVFQGHLGSIRNVHFFWADERCVPPQHPDSNYGLAAKHLFNPLGVPAGHIHRIPGELPPETAATVAARGLSRWTGTDAQEVPVLDLVLLGMGEDGHIASLFPGEPDGVVGSPDFYRAVIAVKPPPHRVTAGYGVLSRSENVWVLASGAGKEAALNESLSALNTTPLGRMLRDRPGTRIYTDLVVASGLAP